MCDRDGYISNEKSATLYTAKINKIYLLDLKKVLKMKSVPL